MMLSGYTFLATAQVQSTCVSLNTIALKGFFSEVNLLSQFLTAVSFFGHQATSLNYLPNSAHCQQLNSVGADVSNFTYFFSGNCNTFR